MPITFTSGTCPISSSEYSLPGTTASGPTSQTASGVYQLYLDSGSMVAGDQVRIRAYEKVDSASTQRLIEEWILSGAQSKPMFVTPTFILGQGWDFTATILSSSPRTFMWSIRKLT